MTQARAEKSIVFNGDTFQLGLSLDGRIASFTGWDQKELLNENPDLFFARIRFTEGAKPISCSAILRKGETQTTEFLPNGAEHAIRRAVFHVEEKPRFLTFELTALERGDFVTMSKNGSTIGGLMDSFVATISQGLQYDVPLRVFIDKFEFIRFEPQGMTRNPGIPIAKTRNFRKGRKKGDDEMCFIYILIPEGNVGSPIITGQMQK